MIRGKFQAIDDMDLSNHHLLNWRWLSDLPTNGATDGQAIILVDGIPTWATISTSGGDTGPVNWTDIVDVPTEFPPSAHTHDWDSITDKPTTFTPSTHIHPLSQLQQSSATTGQVVTWNSTLGQWVPADPAAGPGGGVTSVIAGTGVNVSTSVGDVTITCNLTWSELGDKPTTFTPSAHTHSLSALTQTGATTGQIITWDSTDAQWEPRTPSGSSGGGLYGDTVLNPSAGVFVANGRTGASGGNRAMTANIQRIHPFIPQHAFDVSGMAFRMAIADAGDSAVILIFDADADGRPTTLLFQSAAIATDAPVGIKSDATATFSFEANKMYWVGLWSSNNPTVTGLGADGGYQLGFSGASAAHTVSLRRAVAYGGVSTDWTYDNAQLSTELAPLVLFTKA